MVKFTRSESELVSRAYHQAVSRLEALEACNERRPSATRTAAIEEIEFQLEQVDALGFFEQKDFTPEDIRALEEVARELIAIEESLVEAHEFTLMSLECDLAEFLQSIGLDEYLPALTLAWRTSRSRLLPRDIPADAQDEFRVTLFTRVQGRLNQIAHGLYKILEFKSLNRDDYNSETDRPPLVPLAMESANSTVESTLRALEIKQAAKAAAAEKANDDVSVAGQVWDVIGWDSPSDFLIDLGFSIATGGISKIYKWGKRVVNTARRGSKAATALQRYLKIERVAGDLERRAAAIRDAAAKLKKIQGLANFPARVEKLFKVLNTARGKQVVLAQAGSTVTWNYIRDVASSLASRSSGFSSSAQVGSTMSREAAKAAIFAYLDGTALGTRIRELRKKNTFGMLLLRRGDSWAGIETFLHYFTLLFARQFIARMALADAHSKEASGSVIAKEVVDSAAAAIEAILWDVPLIREAMVDEKGNPKQSAIVQNLIQTVVAYIRKVLAEIVTSTLGVKTP